MESYNFLYFPKNKRLSPQEKEEQDRHAQAMGRLMEQKREELTRQGQAEKEQRSESSSEGSDVEERGVSSDNVEEREEEAPMVQPTRRRQMRPRRQPRRPMPMIPLGTVYFTPIAAPRPSNVPHFFVFSTSQLPKRKPMSQDQ